MTSMGKIIFEVTSRVSKKFLKYIQKETMKIASLKHSTAIEAYLESIRTSKTKLSVKVVNG